MYQTRLSSLSLWLDTYDISICRPGAESWRALTKWYAFLLREEYSAVPTFVNYQCGPVLCGQYHSGRFWACSARAMTRAEPRCFLGHATDLGAADSWGGT